MRITILIMLCMWSLFVHADETVGRYKADKSGAGTTSKLYIMGVATGFQYANSYLDAKHQKPLFCPPQQLVLEMENFLTIVNNELKRVPYTDDDQIEVVLLFGLKNVFPCADN